MRLRWYRRQKKKSWTKFLSIRKVKRKKNINQNNEGLSQKIK